jgi:hypothetical protein
MDDGSGERAVPRAELDNIAGGGHHGSAVRTSGATCPVELTPYPSGFGAYAGNFLREIIGGSQIDGTSLTVGQEAYSLEEWPPPSYTVSTYEPPPLPPAPSMAHEAGWERQYRPPLEHEKHGALEAAVVARLAERTRQPLRSVAVLFEPYDNEPVPTWRSIDSIVGAGRPYELRGSRR